ncbi:hypothetical protein [Streptosporangium sp. NPDC001681]
MSGIEDLENSEPGDRRIDGRPLTAREWRAILKPGIYCGGGHFPG